MPEKLMDVVSVQQAVYPLTKTTGALTGLEINATGFDRAAFIIPIGTMTPSTGRLGAKIRHSNATGGTFTDVASAALTTVVATGTNKIFIIDMAVSGSRPFLKLYGTATKTVGIGAVCVLYRGSRRWPVANSNILQKVEV